MQKRTIDERATFKRLRPFQVIAQTSRPGLKDTLWYLLRRTRLTLRADAATVLFFDEASLRLKPIVSDGLGEAVEEDEDLLIPLGKGIAGRIATSPNGLIFHNVVEMPVISGASRGGVKSVAGVPLRIGDRLLGVIHVGSVVSVFFEENDLLILRLVGERVAAAVERERVLKAEQRVATPPQESP